MLDRAFELRYQVYCVERRFLPSSHYPTGRETDEHDDDSAHFGAYNAGNDLLGYVRLVQPTGGQFPFQQHCDTLLLDDERLPDAAECAEISRLMVSKDYRSGGRLDNLRRVDEDDVAPTGDARRAHESTGILLQLYRGMYGYSLNSGIRYLYAAMERSLARSLRRWNFGFTQISAETDYFGPVAVYMLDLRDLEARLMDSNPALLDWLRTTSASLESPAALAPLSAQALQVRHLAGSPERRSRERTPLQPLPAARVAELLTA